MAVVTGAHATVELTVTDADTAASLRSGDVPVLGSPRLIAVCEEAACLAIADQLKAGETTVGLRIEFTHVAPTRVGSRVRAEATLERADGRRMVFLVSATDECGLIGAGKVTRVIVDRDEFIDKAR